MLFVTIKQDVEQHIVVFTEESFFSWVAWVVIGVYLNFKSPILHPITGMNE
jgi:hypothetical protein